MKKSKLIFIESMFIITLSLIFIIESVLVGIGKRDDGRDSNLIVAGILPAIVFIQTIGCLSVELLFTLVDQLKTTKNKLRIFIFFNLSFVISFILVAGFHSIVPYLNIVVFIFFIDRYKASINKYIS